MHTRNTILSQYLHEYSSWIRMLDYFKQENSFLKMRLSDVLEVRGGHDFLAQAEHFQNQFIIKDECIDELLHDAELMEKEYLEKQETDTMLQNTGFIKRHNKLRNEMDYFEKEFTRLKNEFNGYLLSTMA